MKTCWYDSELKPGLSNHLEEWDGERGGKDIQVGGGLKKTLEL